MATVLTSFTPSNGPKAGFTFTLPYLAEPHKPILHFSSSIQTLPRATGSWIPSGTAPIFPSHAEITCIFRLSPAWLKQQGYWIPSGLGANSSNAALDTAIVAMNQHLLMGGQGSLLATPSTGTTHGIGGATLTSYTASAWCYADSEPDRYVGGDMADWNITFIVPSAQWTLSDGNLILIS